MRLDDLLEARNNLNAARIVYVRAERAAREITRGPRNALRTEYKKCAALLGVNHPGQTAYALDDEIERERKEQRDKS